VRVVEEEEEEEEEEEVVVVANPNPTLSPVRSAAGGERPGPCP
jgi:hypothetical protein